MKRYFGLGALVLAAGVIGLQVGCSTHDNEESREDEDDIGLAQIAISEVPLDGSVGCIAVTATGSFTVTQSEDVQPGQSALLDLNHLPVGTVSFTGNAYQGPCAAVQPGTVPTWSSAPVLASVNNVEPVVVHLVMKKNGKANVDVDFDDDPACGVIGAPCVSSAECCSQICVNGTCQSGAPMCSPGFTLCPTGCFDLTSDSTNCGACGNTCPAGAACQFGACVVPSCADNVKNGTESDVDCGGGTCPPCAAGSQCNASSDCQVGLCINATCASCQTALDCPTSANECMQVYCASGTCGIAEVAAGTPCAQNGGTMCDGNGFCI